MFFHFILIYLQYVFCGDKNDQQENISKLSDGVKSVNDSQPFHVTNVLDLSTGTLEKDIYPSKHTFSSILLQNQNSLFANDLETQDKPLDLTTSSGRHDRMLIEPSSKIHKSQSLKRSQPYENNPETGPSPTKVVILENFAQSQEKLQNSPEKEFQSVKSSKRKQKTPSRDKSYENQTDETGSQSTHFSNLHFLATCASKAKIYSEQQKVQSIMPAAAINENSFTLVNIQTKYADLIEKSHLTKIHLQNIRDEISELVSKSELKKKQHCCIIEIAFNTSTERNRLLSYNANFNISEIESFIHESGKITCFGFKVSKPNLGIFCTFFVPDSVFNYYQFANYNNEENSHIRKTGEGHTQVTMIIRKRTEMNETSSGKNEFLWGIPYKNNINQFFKHYFIGFHNRQAFLFRRCGWSYGQYRFTIQLLDDKNCQNLKDSTSFFPLSLNSCEKS